MKGWIERMNQIAAGMLFNGGYVTAPMRGAARQTDGIAGDSRQDPAVTAGRTAAVTNEPGHGTQRQPARLVTN